MKVVVNGMCWLEREELTSRQISNIKSDLTILPKRTTDIAQAKDPEPIFLFNDDPDNGRIGVPRGYYLKRKSDNHEEVLDVSYGSPMGEFESKCRTDGPFVEQGTVIEALNEALEGRKWGGVFLRADPGFGKTITALNFAHRMGIRTLILVHKDFLVRQWRNRIKQFMPGAKVGIIKQKKCEYKEIGKTGEAPDFVIALVQSLTGTGTGTGTDECPGKYPYEMYSAFGLVISDELHRIGAPSWAPIIPRFNAAYRLGLTATPRRTDGADGVFFEHISEITYSAKTKMMKPAFRRIFTDAQLKPIVRGKYRVDIDKLNSAQIINQLAADKFRSRQIVDDLFRAVMAGRKILVTSERLGHLKSMAEDLEGLLAKKKFYMRPKLDFYTGQWFTGEVWESTNRNHRRGDPKMKTRSEEELREAEKANVIFATKQIVEEGFDVPSLDVLVMSIPMSDIEQIVGRVQRWCLPEEGKCEHFCPWRAGKCEGKRRPIVTDVVDQKIGRLMGKYKRRMTFYKKIGAVK